MSVRSMDEWRKAPFQGERFQVAKSSGDAYSYKLSETYGK